MPFAGRGVRRVARLSCLAGSIGLAAAGVITAPAAGASGAPNYTYSSVVSAIGAQLALTSNPEPSSIPDLTDVQFPSSDAQLDSFGTSESNGHVVNLNGLGSFPALICLASAAFCRAIPINQASAGTINSFPPPDPVDAHATYPANQSSTSPKIGSKAASVVVKQGPVRLAGGNSTATATATTTSTTAEESDVSLVGAVTIGSIRTTTNQRVTPAGLHTDATAVLSDINIGTKLVHIGSVRSSLTIDSPPKAKPVDHASTQIGDVTAFGKAATIDRHGLRVKGTKLPSAVRDAYQKAVDGIFKAAGFGIRQAAVVRHDGQTGHTVEVDGLQLFIKHTVKGAPPVTIGLPQGVPCPLPHSLPLDACAGVGLPLNAKYRGQIGLGELNAISLAQPADQPTTCCDPTNQHHGGKKNSNPTTGGSGGSSSFGGGGGSSGGLPGGGSDISTSPSDGLPPTLPGAAYTLADPLSGLQHRIWWFFPLIAISLLSLLGRFRFPARLPSQ
ncbi:MAG: hypothetical protein JO214_05215 [Frankiaceae bacterium]|nr:hypothetical protein [Frankiaceae bacterium]